MNIVGSVIKTLLGILFIAFCTMVVTFILAIFNPDGVLKAIEIFKGILGV